MSEGKANAKPSVRETAARFSAYAIPCAVTLFILDTLYRLDSLLKAFALPDLSVTMSAMFLILLIVAMGAALAGTGIALLAWPFRQAVTAMARLLAFVLIVLLMSRAVLHWWLKVTDWESWLLGQWASSMSGFTVPSATVVTFYYACVILATLIWLIMTRLAKPVLQEFESVGRRMARAMPLVAVLPLFVLGHHLLVRVENNAAPVCASRGTPNSGISEKTASGALPDIVLVTFDALTARDMSLYGYRLPTTPNMERLARESTVYEHAMSVANWTKPGTVSILTGQYPNHHRLFSTLSDAMVLQYPERTLPNQLRSLGYQTSAVVSNPSFAHPMTNGTYRSFDSCSWDAFAPEFVDGNIFRRLRHAARNRIGALLLDHDIHVSGWLDDLLNSFAAFRFWHRNVVWNTTPFAPPEQTFATARQAISQEGGRPKFVWVHVFAPHAPYLPNRKYEGRFLPEGGFRILQSQDSIPGSYSGSLQPTVDLLRLRYDEYILNADQELGGFVDFLKKSGRWENTLFVLSADHGESFEHGIYGHRGEYLYEQMTHIPLLIHMPGQREGQRMKGSASQVDIGPTILHFLRAPIPPWMDGEPLEAFAHAGMRGSYRYAMEIEANGIRFPVSKGTVAASDGRYKLIHSLTCGTTELFDLSTDPDESTNIAGKNPALAERLKAAALGELGRH